MEPQVKVFSLGYGPRGLGLPTPDLAEQKQSRTTPHLQSKWHEAAHTDSCGRWRRLLTCVLSIQSSFTITVLCRVPQRNRWTRRVEILNGTTISGSINGEWRWNREAGQWKGKGECKDSFLPTSRSTIIWGQQCKKHTKSSVKRPLTPSERIFKGHCVRMRWEHRL